MDSANYLDCFVGNLSSRAVENRNNYVIYVSGRFIAFKETVDLP